MTDFEATEARPRRTYNAFEYAVYAGGIGLVGADGSGNDVEFLQVAQLDMSEKEAANE